MTERYLVAGQYRLDLRDERLWVGESPARIGGKAFALLRALMEQPQTLVTKDELFESAWPGLAVSESVLTTAVKELRRALGDDARQPVLIETVHGRGYRFLLPVERLDALPAPDAPPSLPQSSLDEPRRSPRRWAIGAAAVALLLLLLLAAVLIGRGPGLAPAANAANSKSVAVLRFDDFSQGEAQRWFADGLTEEILNSLARVPDLRVASRAAAAELGKAGVTPRDAARSMGVAHILEGSVRRSGGRVRVTAELSRTSDGFQLWSQNYDRPASDVISIQEDIAFEIASALKTVMDPVKLQAMASAGTRSVEAYEAYLQGVALDQRQFDDGDLRHARGAADAYEKARTLDPNFTLAHWRAAQTWFGNATRVDSSIRGDSATEAVRLDAFFERVDRAIATSKDQTEALKYRAARALMQLQLNAAHRLMTRYLEARPRDIDAWETMADIAAYSGKRKWMARAAERIFALSIEDGNPRSRAITISVMALQLDDAIARARRLLALRPDNALTQYQAHRALIWAGRPREARTLLERVRHSRMPEHNRVLAELRQACAEGRIQQATELRTRLGRIGNLNARWQAAQTIGDVSGATALLAPLDRPDRLPTLMQFMINPSFDRSAYPLLDARLKQNAVERPAPVPMPFACRPSL